VRARFFVVVLASGLAACSSASPAVGTDGASGTSGASGAPGTDATVQEAAIDLANEPTPEAPAAFDATTTPDAGPGGGDAPAAEKAPPTSRTIGDIYCAGGAGAATDPLPANRQPVVVSIAPPGGISFLEGPVWLADRGVLLLSEWNGGHRILQVTPPQAVEVFLPSTGTNGLALAPDGKSLLVVVTEGASRSLSRVTLADKSVQPLVQSYMGQAFMQPNDVAVRADGTIYFTDYQAGRLYRRAPDGALSLISSIAHSNGVAVSPDEKTLYLNTDARTVKYPLAADGTPGPGTDFVTGLQGGDGIAIDCAGNVYIAQNMGGAVVVASPSGTKLGELTGLPQTVTNAAFGGADHRTLYITTNSALYMIAVQMPGLPY